MSLPGLLLWLVLASALVLAVTQSAWWYLLCGSIFLWKAGRICFVYGSRWRRVHFPFMRRYAVAAGYCNGQGLTGEDCMRAALIKVLMSQKFAKLGVEASDFVEEQWNRLRGFKDEESLAKELHRRFSEKADKIIGSVRTAFSSLQPGLRVRSIVAGLIEKRYGERERLNYLMQVILGNAS